MRAIRNSRSPVGLRLFAERRIHKDGTRINPSNSLRDRIIVTLTGKPRGILPYIAFMSKVYSDNYVLTAVRFA